MDKVRFGTTEVSRFIIGGNPFSGFSHQTPQLDDRMRHYYTTARIKQTLREAEAAGITTVIARLDFHICRVLMEYWDEGGKLNWLGQTCPELGSPETAIRRAKQFGASACYIHGGYMDFLLAQGRLAEVPPLIALIRSLGMTPGIAGHNPEVFRWAERVRLDVDFYMCCYYNSAHRDQRAEHVSGMSEWFLEEDRKVMTDLIQTLSRPAIHYKVMAAGRNDPAKALEFAASKMRPGDAVCVGVYTEHKRDMIAENVRLFEQALKALGKA
jgi:hypothetical protein